MLIVKTKLVLSLIVLITTNLYSLNIDKIINKDNCDLVIDKKAFNICYSFKYKGALAVGYSLDGNLVKKQIEKRFRFYSEKNVPLRYRSKSSDYTKSGFDRGHLASDASFDHNEDIVRKTYSMANVVPQYPKLNRYVWLKAEKYERSIASKFNNVSVLNLVHYGNKPMLLGKNKISIPVGFYKILWNNEKRFKKCFYFGNTNSYDLSKDKLKKHLVKCPI